MTAALYENAYLFKEILILHVWNLFSRWPGYVYYHPFLEAFDGAESPASLLASPDLLRGAQSCRACFAAMTDVC